MSTVREKVREKNIFSRSGNCQGILKFVREFRNLRESQGKVRAGFIRVREMSGKFKIFQGQGIVREFHNLSGKIEFLLKCQGNVREF